MSTNPSRLAELQALMRAPDTNRRNFKGMLYGNMGVGKTHLALQLLDSIVDPGRLILHVDTSYNKDIYDQVNLTHTVQPLPFTTIEDLRLITEAIINKQGPWGHIGGILFDEASSMASEDIDRVFETRKNLIENNQMRMPKDGMPSVPDWADYRPALQRFRSMLADLFDIPSMHVVLIAHETVDKNMAGTATGIGASFTPASRKEIVKPLHLVARVTAVAKQVMGSDNVEYERDVQIHPVGIIQTKSRLGIPNVRFNATYLPDLVKGWVATGAIERKERDTIPEPAVSGEAIDPFMVSDILPLDN